MAYDMTHMKHESQVLVRSAWLANQSCAPLDHVLMTHGQIHSPFKPVIHAHIIQASFGCYLVR